MSCLLELILLDHEFKPQRIPKALSLEKRLQDFWFMPGCKFFNDFSSFEIKPTSVKYTMPFSIV